MSGRTFGEWEPWYRALRAAQPEAYRKAINYAEGVTLNMGVSTRVAAQYEHAMVLLACDILGVNP